MDDKQHDSDKERITWPPSPEEYRPYSVGTRTGESYTRGEDGVFAVTTLGFKPTRMSEQMTFWPTVVIVSYDDDSMLYFTGDKVEWIRLEKSDTPVRPDDTSDSGKPRMGFQNFVPTTPTTV